MQAKKEEGKYKYIAKRRKSVKGKEELDG